MHDIIDVIKNLETLTANDSAFKVLKDFERVIDELDIYVFSNWEDGELVTGPEVDRYAVTCKFMWPYESMPDPDGGARLVDYGCKVGYKKDHVMIPRKIYQPSDFRPETKKGKIDAHPVWIITITMPKKLMQDIYQGYLDKENAANADLMRYNVGNEVNEQQAAQENPADEAPAPEVPAAEVPTAAPQG
jgi:hypothetical protein